MKYGKVYYFCIILMIMDLQVLEKTEQKLLFSVEGIAVEMANAIRRIIFA